MWADITIALASALIGTFFGTFFLARREENKVKKVRAIAIRALEIIKGYAKYNGTYNKACQELNTKLNIAEKRAQGGLSVAGRCRCLTKDSNTSIEKEGYIPYSLQA